MKLEKISGNEHGWWFICGQNSVWLPNNRVPHGYAHDFQLLGYQAQCIGQWHGELAWLVHKPQEKDMYNVRSLLEHGDEIFGLAGKAVQLAEFYRSHRFCGYCGHEMQWSEREWACLCPQCRERYYTQIAPCIIVVIRKDDSLLLAQHNRHRGGIYTALAGFVEVGENLENAVKREVMEESHIEIQNLRYVSSQPWPFPHSLMMGYMADYKDGEIGVDHSELIDAQWFRFDKLPMKLPIPGTIARRLIEDTVILCRDSEFNLKNE